MPGGFGERGSEGKILAAKFARERKVRYFGICFGMQMACIEAARSLAGIAGASSPSSARPRPVVGLMTEWLKGNMLEKRKRSRRSRRHDAARRLRRRTREESKIAAIYGDTHISERHRHRYEVNIDYKARLEGARPAAAVSPTCAMPHENDRAPSRPPPGLSSSRPARLQGNRPVERTASYAGFIGRHQKSRPDQRRRRAHHRRVGR